MNMLDKILGLLPLLIRGAEQLKGPGNGADKAAVVISAAMEVLSAVLPADRQEAVANGVQAAINGTVAVLNAAGALQHS